MTWVDSLAELLATYVEVRIDRFDDRNYEPFWQYVFSCQTEAGKEAAKRQRNYRYVNTEATKAAFKLLINHSLSSSREASPDISSPSATDPDGVRREPVPPLDDCVDIAPHLQPRNAAWSTLESNRALKRGINLGICAEKGLPGAAEELDLAVKVMEDENAEARKLIIRKYIDG